MDQDLLNELPGIVKVYKNGTVQRLIATDFVPPSTDPNTAVSSKDVTILPETGVSARIFLPKVTRPDQKFPLLVYFHGGAFCISSPFTQRYHNYLTALVAEAIVVAVSVNYRKAPEHPIPAAYEDSWAALHWVIAHTENGHGQEDWLKHHADFGKLFLGGDSAGANIAHNLGVAAGDPDYGLAVPILGLALVHPYFWGSDAIGSELTDPDRKARVDRLWPFICPSNPDNDDPRVNPVADGGSGLSGLGCGRVLVCVAEKDISRDRGRVYFEKLGRSGWMGVVEIKETEEEDHAFHLNDVEGQKAMDLIKHLAFLYNRDIPPLYQHLINTI